LLGKCQEVTVLRAFMSVDDIKVGIDAFGRSAKGTTQGVNVADDDMIRTCPSGLKVQCVYWQGRVLAQKNFSHQLVCVTMRIETLQT